MWKRFLVFLLLLLCPLAVRAQLSSQGKEQQITYSGTTAGIAFNQPAPNFTVTTGVNTFIMSVNPNNVARIYLSNETANACANFTVSVASTAQPNATSFNNTPQVWQTVQTSITGSALGNTTPVTLPALGTVTVTSATILGNRIAIFVVLSSGCATTNLDITVIFGQTTIVGNAIQGLIPAGGSPASENPVLIGYKDSASGLVGVVQGNNGGINLGGSGVSVGGTYSQVLAPSFAPGQNAPITEALYANEPGGSIVGPLMESLPASAGACSPTTGCPGMFTADSGFWFQPPTLSNTGSTTSVLWRGPSASGFNNIANSFVESCAIHVSATNTAGTTPTLDIFFQDGLNGVIWNDRIHFTQISGALSGANLAAGIAGTSANLPVTTYQDGALAAGTIVNGPLGPWARLKFVVGGTAGPLYNITFGVVCK